MVSGTERKPAGAWASCAGSKTLVWIAACGQIIEQKLHCTQRSVCQMGMSRASARFSNLLVLVGHVPSGGKALTGSSSPRPSSKRRVTRCTKSGACGGTAGRRRRAAVTVLGTSTSKSAASAASSAATLRFTTSGPRRPQVSSIERRTCCIASSGGSTLLSEKKQICITVLMRRPKPARSATP